MLSAAAGGRDWLVAFRIELVDYVAIFFLYDAALQLERVGESAVVEGEILGKQCKTLDGFPLREMHGQALHLLLDEGAHEGVRGHFFMRGKMNSLLLSLCGDGGCVGDDQRDHKSPLIADDHGVGDVGAGFSRVFDRLRRDEFSASRLD